MTSRFCCGLATGLVLSLAGCDDEPGSASGAIANQLRECRLVSQGSVSPHVGESEVDQCRARCRVEATCEELEGYYCDDRTSARLRDCELACVGPQDCADGSGSYRVSERCDGTRDCDDGSDELGCPEPSGEGPEYCAASGARIYEFQRCDGFDDCGDGTDEENCPNPPRMFRCERMVGGLIQEIPLTKVCDLERDCVDGSDESEAQGCASLLCN
jgi:hypothetical protein